MTLQFVHILSMKYRFVIKCLFSLKCTITLHGFKSIALLDFDALFFNICILLNNIPCVTTLCMFLSSRRPFDEFTQSAFHVSSTQGYVSKCVKMPEIYAKTYRC